jgi:hypothetical protein
MIIDLPAYSAQGRAAFERGNGLAFPNPGNPDPRAPVIYCHWFSWLLGLGIVYFGFDPGIQFFIVGVLCSLLLAWLTLLLVEAVLPSAKFKALLFLITMWGGGIICLAAITANWLKGEPLDDALLRNDPGGGWWFLNWGRNIVFPTEAAYHVVVAACWLAVLRNTWGWALLAAAAIAATHPFTGFEVLLSLLLWSSVLLLLNCNRTAAIRWLLVVAIAAAFVLYNFVFLERFEEHRVVRQQMTIPWMIGLVSMALAYGPVGLLAGMRICHQRSRLDAKEGFLLTSFATAFLLINHGWFITPRQPVHFTRGYVWMPLCLLGLPYLQQLLATWRNQVRPAVFLCLAGGILAIAVSDNAGFIIHYWRLPELGIVLKQSDWDALHWMRRHNLNGTFVSSDRQITYLASTYTSLRAYYSHWQHTPNYDSRVRLANQAMQTGTPRRVIREMDFILLPKHHAIQTLQKISKVDFRHWTVVYENEDWALLGATGPHSQN